jgi:hypothetical protein
MNDRITPADLAELAAALAPLDALDYPPDVSADDGNYECPACGGEGCVDGVATADTGLSIRYDAFLTAHPAATPFKETV